MATSQTMVSKQATWGLLGAWAVHDLEELITMAPTSRWIVARLRARYPQVPDGVWERLEVAPAQAAVAVGLVGGVMAAAAVAGGRSGGRSAFYQAVLAGFGWHADPTSHRAARSRTSIAPPLALPGLAPVGPPITASTTSPCWQGVLRGYGILSPNPNGYSGS
jgi:hypothetical protein